MSEKRTMVENTDAEQIEKLNARVVELLTERDALREQLVRKQPTRERVAETIGWYLACVVAGNNQPHMSGDPRNRVPPGKRRSFDDACLACADAILSLSDEHGAREMTSSERASMERATAEVDAEVDAAITPASGKSD